MEVRWSQIWNNPRMCFGTVYRVCIYFLNDDWRLCCDSLTVHVHAGNVVVDGNSCRLLDFENSLLGLPSLHRRVYSQLHRLHVSVC